MKKLAFRFFKSPIHFVWETLCFDGECERSATTSATTQKCTEVFEKLAHSPATSTLPCRRYFTLLDRGTQLGKYSTGESGAQICRG